MNQKAEKEAHFVTFQQLQYLLEVSRTGSVTKSAKNLFVSYSSISIAIGNLEKELGYPLFERKKTGLVPTQSGEMVLQYAGQICQAYEQIRSVGKQVKRNVRINCLDYDIYSRVFAQLLEEYRDGGTNITMTAYGAEELYQRLMHNELDLCVLTVMSFSFGDWEKRLKKGGLNRQILRVLPAAVQVGREHPLYEAERVYPSDLRKYHMVDDSARPLSRSAQFRSVVYTEPKNVIYASSSGARQQIISRGLGYSVSMMPPVDVRKTGETRYIPLEGIHYYIIGATNPRYPVPQEVTRYLQLLSRELEQFYPEILPIHV